MKPIRWKRRLQGWAGFIGTSRKASAWITRNEDGRTWGASARFHSWERAPSWREAAAWCERQFAPPAPRPRPIVALVVYANGESEHRALERLQPALAMRTMRMPPPMRVGAVDDELEPAAQAMIETTTYEARQWAMSYECPMSGVAGTFRVWVYAHPRALPAAVERAALSEIKRRRIMLDEVLYRFGRYGGSRELHQVADHIFDGELD